MEPVSKASFGLNETLQIVVPGYYAFAMLVAYLYLLDPTLRQRGLTDSLFAVFAGLVFGFVLYCWDYPRKRKVYKTGLPSQFLVESDKFSHKPAAGDQKTYYYYILNNLLPQTFHEVVMFKGSLYFCITYVRVISGFLGLLGILTVTLAWIYHCVVSAPAISCCGLQIAVDNRRICWIAFYAIFQILIWLILSYPTPNRADRMLTSIYQDQRKWLELNSFIVDVLLSGVDPRVHTVLKDYYEFQNKGKES